jgi:kinesin family member 18/19
MVKIICRVKPPKESNIKIIEESKILLLKKDKNVLDDSILKPYEFELDKVYDYNISTNEIFDNEIRNQLGKTNIGIFIYGHTGSGKTFTLFGNESNDGIFDLLCKELKFNFEIQAIDLTHSGNYDLFDNKKIFIYTDKNENIKHNASSISVTSKNFDEIKNMIFLSRTSGISKHNQNSSRSHLIIYIYDKVNKITYNIIDLAGNERRPVISSKENEKEVSYINSSLLALKECFRCFNNKFVPYRRSDLTRLLKNIMTDKNKYYNLIISTIHSGYPYFFDSVDTLNYIDGLFSKVKKRINFNERKVKYEVKKRKNKAEPKNIFKKEEKEEKYEKDIINDEPYYSDDFYSEPEINYNIENKKIGDKLKWNDDYYINPDIYSPKKKVKNPSNAFLDDLIDNALNIESKEKIKPNTKLSNIFSEDINPYLIDDFASLDNNDEELNNENIDDIVNIQEYMKIIESNKSVTYKKKIFGVINNFAYKNCISNYKELLDKDLNDEKLSLLILNSIASLKLIIKELQNI